MVTKIKDILAPLPLTMLPNHVSVGIVLESSFLGYVCSVDASEIKSEDLFFREQQGVIFQKTPSLKVISQPYSKLSSISLIETEAGWGLEKVTKLAWVREQYNPPTTLEILVLGTAVSLSYVN